MKFTVKLAVLGLVIATGLTSCVSNKKYNELLTQKEDLAKSLADSQEKIKMLEEQNVQLTEDKDNLTADLEQVKKDLQATMDKVADVEKMVAAKEAELAKVQGDIKTAFSDYEAAGLEISSQGDMIYISMPEKVLFRSGSARLDKSDKEVIGKLAEVLKGDETLSVIVEGHTDNAKLVQGASYNDNWDLSVARAVSVVRELIKQGVAPAQVTAAGAGEFMPAVAEDPSSSAAREANRRTEFIIVPNLNELFNYYKG